MAVLARLRNEDGTFIVHDFATQRWRQAHASTVIFQQDTHAIILDERTIWYMLLVRQRPQ